MLFSHAVELFEGPIVGAGEGGFVADDHGKGVAGVREVLKGPSELGVRLEQVGRELADLFDGVVLEEVGFDGGESAEAPTGRREGFDEFGLESGGGLELLEVGGAEGGELLRRIRWGGGFVWSGGRA